MIFTACLCGVFLPTIFANVPSQGNEGEIERVETKREPLRCTITSINRSRNEIKIQCRYEWVGDRQSQDFAYLKLLEQARFLFWDKNRAPIPSNAKDDLFLTEEFVVREVAFIELGFEVDVPEQAEFVAVEFATPGIASQRVKIPAKLPVKRHK